MAILCHLGAGRPSPNPTASFKVPLRPCRTLGGSMLTFAEELLLLSHDEKTGHFLNMDDAMPALAGAVLMELAIRDRIDTDLDKLMVVDATPTGEPVLDGILAQMAAEPGSHSTDDWVDFLKHNGQEIHDAALDRKSTRLNSSHSSISYA